jgi:hypothetical protein
MIRSCKDCPKFAQCESTCPEVEELLSQDDGFGKYSPEIPVSQFDEVPEEDEPGTRPATIDDFRKIDRAAIFGADTDLDVPWQKNVIVEGDLTSEDYKKIEDSVDVLVLDEKTRGRFKAFLKCAKMTEIAARANISKQNIQKQFQRICKRIARSYRRVKTPNALDTPRIVTPYEVKRKMGSLKQLRNHLYE